MGMYDDIVEMVSGHLRFEGFPDHLTIARRIVSEDECREAQEELEYRERTALVHDRRHPLPRD
jgi:hypothetical protein